MGMFDAMARGSMNNEAFRLSRPEYPADGGREARLEPGPATDNAPATVLAVAEKGRFPTRGGRCRVLPRRSGAGAVVELFWDDDAPRDGQGRRVVSPDDDFGVVELWNGDVARLAAGRDFDAVARHLRDGEPVYFRYTVAAAFADRHHTWRGRIQTDAAVFAWTEGTWRALPHPRPYLDAEHHAAAYDLLATVAAWTMNMAGDFAYSIAAFNGDGLSVLSRRLALLRALAIDLRLNDTWPTDDHAPPTDAPDWTLEVGQWHRTGHWPMRRRERAWAGSLCFYAPTADRPARLAWRCPERGTRLFNGDFRELAGLTPGLSRSDSA